MVSTWHSSSGGVKTVHSSEILSHRGRKKLRVEM